MKASIVAVLFLAVFAVGAEPRNEAEEYREHEVASYREHAARISNQTSRIESFISEEMAKKPESVEYPPARRYAMHDLDGDAIDDLFLITTFEPQTGGNRHESHLFAIVTSRPREVQHLVIGSRGIRDAEKFIQPHDSLHLFLRFQVWAKTDANCCPSLSTTEEILLEGGRVVLRPYDELKRKD